MSKKTTHLGNIIAKDSGELARQLASIDGMLKGSLIERYTVCTRPNCRCARGHKHGPYLYVSVFDGKRSRHIYVPKAMAEQVTAWVKNYHRASAIIERMSALSIERIRLKRQN
jgi:hypothetical protein